ncbi:MAG: ATP-binding protein, partial [Acidobacteriota bacterium]
SIEQAVHDGANTVRRLQRFTERERESQAGPLAVDVSEAIRDVVELTRPRWKNAMERTGRKVEFTMELESCCLAVIHASDLREVMTNLIFNAIEAMPDGGVITLRNKTLDGQVVIEVADTGIGMSNDVVGKIFDPFYTTKGLGNSGLGLSVSWSLIERYGGEIQVRSRPGKGTVFTIRLERASSCQPDRALPAPNRENRYRRLLLVDDDTEILGILRDMLRLKGHRVIAVQDGTRALELLENEDFDLVLTDLGMPLVSGWDVAEKAKAKTPPVPVILITGWGGRYEDEDLSGRGVDMVLSKPLSWEKLLAAIDKSVPSAS